MHVKLYKGERKNHPFRGNQWTHGIGGGKATEPPGYMRPDWQKDPRIVDTVVRNSRATGKIILEGARKHNPYKEETAYIRAIPNYPADYLDLKDIDLRSHVKADICKDISARTGIDPEEVSGVLKAWQMSSNKTDGAIALQYTIAEEFGLEPSDYQKSIWNDRVTREMIPPSASTATEKLPIEGMTRLEGVKLQQTRAGWYDKSVEHYQDSVRKGLDNPTDLEISWKEKYPDAPDSYLKVVNNYKSYNVGVLSQEKTKKIVRAMYDSTQELLKDAPDVLTLHRGMTSINPIDGEHLIIGSLAGGKQISMDELSHGTKAKYQGSIVESWSPALNTAVEFSGFSWGATLTARVPKKSVFCTSLTGTGCLSETEFVIFGSMADNTVWAQSYKGYMSEVKL